MIDIINALLDNLKEARNLLKDKGEVMFAKWDEDEGVYTSMNGNDVGDSCPYIRYADDDGNIASQLVVGVRYNEESNVIEIITAENEYTETDDVWFPLLYADDISYWSVLDMIGEMFD